MLDEEADQLVGAGPYERTDERAAYRAGYYERGFTTTSGQVTLKMPKLKGMRFATAVIERYKRRRPRSRRPSSRCAWPGCRRGVSGRFGLRNRPEVASGVRESLGERGGTVVVDELDAKLHPKLLRYMILLFKDPEVSKNGAHLIFSSQDVSAMRNDVFRRDEVWFAARAEDEASQLWSLANRHEPNGNLVSKNAAFGKHICLVTTGQIRTSRASRNGSSMAAKKGTCCRYAP